MTGSSLVPGSGRVLRSRAAKPTGPNERVVETCGLELFVRERGQGHPLLLVNGLGGNIEMWGPTEKALARRSRLIMFDGPGMGRSQTPVLPMPVPSLARAVVGLLDELGHERVDVLGYSMGGVIAQQLARDAPERIRRLALVSTACGWGSVPGSLAALSVVAMPLRYYSRRLYESTNRFIGEKNGHEDATSEDAQADARLRHPPSLLGYAYLLCAGAFWTSLPWLSSVEVHTLVVTGAADQLVPPANSVQLAGLLPQSRLHLIPDEGHLVLFGESKAQALLGGFFASKTVEASSAWSSGAVIGEAEMHAAVDAAAGSQPVKALSQTFRRFVGSREPG